MKEYAGDEIKRARHTHVQTIYLPTICLGVIFVRVIVLTCGVCMCVSVGGGEGGGGGGGVGGRLRGHVCNPRHLYLQMKT